MSKLFRRIASAVCAGVMVMSMSVGAFALDTDSKGTTIRLDVTSGSTSSTYEAFRLLDLKTALKAKCPEEHPDGEHKDECYSYTYSVNNSYKKVLSNALKAMDNNTDPADLDEGTIIKKLRTLDDDNIREFADSIRVNLKDNFSADATAASDGVFSDVPQGYYLIRENQIGDDPDMRMLVMVDTLGQEDITLKTKEDVPTFTKKIIENAVEVDAQDAAKNDTVHYQLKTVIPYDAYSAFYVGANNGYEIIISDVLTKGLTLKDDTVALKIDNTAIDLAVWDADSDSYINDDNPTGADLVHAPWLKVDTATDSTTMTVTARPIAYLVDSDAVKNKTDVVVTIDYDCTINDTAVTGEAGNPNTAELSFSNDPYSSTTKSKTPDDKVTVFTYKLVVDKVNPTGVALTGADFKLQKKGADGQYVDYEVLNSDTDVSTFTFDGLDAGDYKLIETRVPDGYHEGDPIEFSIVATYEKDSADPKLLTFDIQNSKGESMSTGDKSVFTVTKADGTASAQFVNVSGGKLPSTGGMGAYAFYIGGGVILVAGLTVLIVMGRKKKSVE